ncbi:MAG: GntR family transcriptional regulator [Halanaerobiales bacterium]|nr:GntR family transcriptional regulator [Halanaerobiales bacterium]
MNLSEKAYTTIKNKIILNNDGNSYLSVREIARNLDMSYTPVREAFKKLEMEGLLEKIPNLGYFIPEISNKDIENIFQTRECLETFVLKKVFSKINGQDIEILNQYIKKMQIALEKKDLIIFYNIDKDFHLYFFKKYGNSHLTSFLENIRDRYHLCSKKIILEERDGVRQIIEEHKKIVKNIENKEKDKALKFLSNNIENSKKRLKNGNIYLY